MIDQLPRRVQHKAEALVRQIPQVETLASAARLRKRFAEEKSFRRLQGYELMTKVAEGVEFKDGVEVVKVSRSYAA